MIEKIILFIIRSNGDSKCPIDDYIYYYYYWWLKKVYYLLLGVMVIPNALGTIIIIDDWKKYITYY